MDADGRMLFLSEGSLFESGKLRLQVSGSCGGVGGCFSRYAVWASAGGHIL